MRPLVWLRVDLRARDNRALAQAAQDADRGVVAVFLIAPAMWRDHDDAPAKIEFQLRCLRELSATLRSRNIALLVREAPAASDAPAALLRIAEEHGCDGIYFNDQPEVNERRRDDAVERSFSESGRCVRRFMDQTILDVGELRSGSGGWYSVYTPFRKAWESAYAEREEEARVEQLCAAQEKMVGEPDPIPASVKGFESGIDAELWPAGEDHARRRLRSFVEDRIGEYGSQRDNPGVNGTSTLSPYLTSGVLSARQCLRAALEANDNRLTGGRRGVVTWIGEIIWREFYRHFITAYPRVSMGQAYRRPVDRDVPWRYDEADFEAWAEGRTGYPIVDAAMAQLRTTGWMHNRLRMITAMFLSKHLLIDWRWGERWFMQHLVDGDLAQNNGGWQWSASTGADAAPYFRIFNPTSQSRRFDGDGSFIRRHVEALGGLDGEEIHDPPGLLRESLGYPQPMVEHRSARERALAAFRSE